MRPTEKSEEWWVLSRMNIGLSVPISTYLPIPACPRVKTCICDLLHQGSCFASLLQPSLLIPASLGKKRPGRQPAWAPAVQKANTAKLEAGMSSWRLSQGRAFCSSLKGSWSTLLLEEHDPWSTVNNFFTAGVVDWKSHCEATWVPEWRHEREHGKIKNEPNYPSAALSCWISSYWSKCCLPAP